MSDLPDNVAERAVRSAMINTVMTYGMALSGFVYGIIIANIIAPSAFGVFAVGLALTEAFSRVRVWGFNALIIAATDPDDLQISTQFWLSVGFSLLVPVLLLMAWPVLRLFFAPVVLWMAVAVSLAGLLSNMGLASTTESLLAKDLRYGVLATFNFGSDLAKMLTTIAFALFIAPTGWALFAGYTARLLIYCIGMWVYAPRRPRFLFSVERARGLLRQGAKLLWGGIGSFLAYKYDDIVVGAIGGQVAAGYYDRAYSWSLMPMTIVAGVLNVVAPTYAKVKAVRAALSEAVSSVFDIVALIAVPASVGLATIAHNFVATFVPDFAAAAPMIQILIIYSLFRPLNDSIGSLAHVLDKNEVHTHHGIAQTVTMLTFGTGLAYLFHRFSPDPNAAAYGGAIAAGVTVVVGFLVFYNGLLKDHVDVPYARIFAPPLIGSALAAIITLALQTVYLPSIEWQALAYKMAIFIAVYGTVIFLTARQRVVMRFSQLLAVARPSKTEAGDDSQGNSE